MNGYTYNPSKISSCAKCARNRYFNILDQISRLSGYVNQQNAHSRARRIQENAFFSENIVDKLFYHFNIFPVKLHYSNKNISRYISCAHFLASKVVALCQHVAFVIAASSTWSINIILQEKWPQNGLLKMTHYDFSQLYLFQIECNSIHNHLKSIISFGL